MSKAEAEVRDAVLKAIAYPDQCTSSVRFCFPGMTEEQSREIVIRHMLKKRRAS